MKKIIRKWAIRISATVILCVALLLTFVMNPSLLYAHETVQGNFRIHHQKPLDPLWFARIDQASALLKNSELYDDSSSSMNICLNDGSKYPALLAFLQGSAFGRGFHNKIVLHGVHDVGANFNQWHERRWNLTQLIAHEAVHCLQFNKYGLWKSRPIANIPNWKWEGYPEYISRQNIDQLSLTLNINRLQGKESSDDHSWIDYEDGTGSSLMYFKYWLLVKYCIEVRQMSFDSLIKDSTDHDQLWKEMMNWHSDQKRITGQVSHKNSH